ncbi:hypothetical protein [uncultured Oscillibacter sp.]|uniref:hypothetical protein n=1 Tax=uncultured Oscillibacter sp. TaxID=876091 RepID=UPI00263957A7|nr:hypothetical protein [uncultured Oscillibacter sp.]
MRIKYENNKVQRYFGSYDLMAKKVGMEITRAIKKHMDRLNAVESFQSFLTLGLGKPHMLSGNLAGCYAVSVSGNMRLILKPDSDDHSAGALKQCKVVMVKGLGDYHGGKIDWFIP